MLFLFEIDRVKIEPKARVIAYGIVAALIVLSDSLVIALFVVPYVAYYVYRNVFTKPETVKSGNKKKVLQANSLKKEVTARMNIAVLSIVVLSGFAWVLKTYICAWLNLPIFWVMPINIGTANGPIATQVSTFFSSLALLLNENLFNVFQARLDIFSIAIAALFLALFAYALLNKNKKAGYLYFMFIISAFVLLAAFIFTDYGSGLYSARFLSYTAVTVFAVIVLAYRDTGIGRNLNTLFIIGIILLVLSTIPANIKAISGLDYQPNKEDYGTIDYLIANNLTICLSDYNVGNKLTYLSHEEVRARAVTIDGTISRPYCRLSATRWYSEIPPKSRL